MTHVVKCWACAIRKVSGAIVLGALVAILFLV